MILRQSHLAMGLRVDTHSHVAMSSCVLISGTNFYRVLSRLKAGQCIMSCVCSSSWVATHESSLIGLICYIEVVLNGFCA